MSKIFSTVLLLLFGNYLCFGEITSEIFFQEGSPNVKLSETSGVTGTIKFSRDGRPYTSFMGIPFATISERFAPSELIKKPTWEGFRDGSKAGPMCPFKALFADVHFTDGEFDCLNLNVYVPMSSKGHDRPLPVMVWVHGGGFVLGTGSSYGAKYFMDEDVILVTINYRTGVFGFLSTGDEAVPGNNGLKDQVRALEWVRDNIGKFGGNPKEVTVFGESAGGVSANYLLFSPTTKGLIHRVISQSGTTIGNWELQTYSNAKKVAQKLFAHLRCNGPNAGQDETQITSEEILSCFKDKSAMELTKGQSEFAPIWPATLIQMIFLPVVEPEASSSSKNKPFLTESPLKILTDSSKSVQDIPWLLGVLQNEGAMVAPNSEKDLNELNDNWNELITASLGLDKFSATKDAQDKVAEKLRKFYLKGNDVTMKTKDDVMNIYSDFMFNYGTRKSAVEVAAKGNKVYLYEFAYPVVPVASNPMFKAIMSAGNPDGEKFIGHGQDLFVQFDECGLFPPEAELNLIEPGSKFEEFSKNLIKLLVSFAKYGEPTHAWGNKKNSKWTSVPKNAGKDLKYYRIDENPNMIDEPYKERMEFCEKLWTEDFAKAILEKPVLKPGKTEL